MTEPADRDGVRGTHVLITGGLGVLGSNLAIALVGLGARVTRLIAMHSLRWSSEWRRSRRPDPR